MSKSHIVCEMTFFYSVTKIGSMDTSYILPLCALYVVVVKPFLNHTPHRHNASSKLKEHKQRESAIKHLQANKHILHQHKTRKNPKVM